jgi:NAD-dependent SIR2 family protein deacetylase
LSSPGVVWFNEQLDDAILCQIEDKLHKADLLLIVGTSSAVYPAAGFAPEVAARCDDAALGGCVYRLCTASHGIEPMYVTLAKSIHGCIHMHVLRRGVPVVEINLESTGNSDVCALAIHGHRAGELLPILLGVEDEPSVVAAGQ